jgi:hypothetical protein
LKCTVDADSSLVLYGMLATGLFAGVNLPLLLLITTAAKNIVHISVVTQLDNIIC